MSGGGEHNTEDEEQQLHIVMFPWLAFGHLIPFLELSKCLAQKGHRISFISTPRNIQRLPNIPSNLSPLLTFIELPLPRVDNLPDKAEATTDLPLHKVPYLKKAFDGLQGPVTTFLEATIPDWIIYDFAPHWLPPIAAKLCVSSAFFSIFKASTLGFMASPSAVLNGEEEQSTKLEDMTVPPKWIPFPCNMAFRKFEILIMMNASQANVSGVSDMFRLASTVQGCDLVLVRSCTEFEPEWFHFLQDKHFRKPVIPIGFLPSSPSRDTKDEKWVVISEWLGQHETGSVVYVAFGTEAALSQEETTQIALGLEVSRLPFFWVLRRPSGENSALDMLPTGFEDRTRRQGQGIIWREWAPQLLILDHPSVGSFLSHSGWSSIIESLGLGCPLVLFPISVDQPLIARYLESKKLGLVVPRNEEDGSFTKESVAETLKMVMVDREGGEPYRTNAIAMRQVFGDQLRHDRYIVNFLECLRGKD